MPASSSPGRQQLGRQAELWSARFLAGQGYTLVASNYHCRYGEIDLVVSQGQDLVFVEVRLRSARKLGGAAESVSPQKQRKLVCAARNFLLDFPHYASYYMRFDVMALDRIKPGGKTANIGEARESFSVEWIQHAFMAE